MTTFQKYRSMTNAGNSTVDFPVGFRLHQTFAGPERRPENQNIQFQQERMDIGLAGRNRRRAAAHLLWR